MTMIETIIVIGTVVGALITSTCWSIRRSRCSSIEMPCLTIHRELMTKDEMESDTFNNNNVI